MFKCSKYSKCSKCCVQNKNHFSRRKRKGEIKWSSIFFQCQFLMNLIIGTFFQCQLPIFYEFNHWYYS